MDGMTRVSAFDDPTGVSELAQSLMADADKPADFQPIVIDRPPDCSVVLPGGLLVDPQGEPIRDAEVRELTGADEEALSKADAMRNPARYIQTLLTRAVVRLGPYEPPSKDHLAALLIGDRNALLLGIRKATYGTEIEMSITCPRCEQVLDIVFDLDTDIPVRALPDPSKRLYEVELRRGRKAKVSLPCGADQDAVLAGDSRRSVSEMNTLMLSRCIHEVDGQSMTVAAARSLGMQDRRTVLDFLADQQPGPRLEEVNEECPACETKIPVPLDLFDMFRG